MSKNDPVHTSSSTRDEEFNRNFQQLMLHADDNGVVKLDTRNKDQKRLSNWFGRQKKRKAMSDEQRELIDHLRLVSREEENKKAWEIHFSNLLNYKRENNTFVIAKKDITNRPLYTWVAEQRRDYRKGTITDERKNRLLEVGFDFEPCGKPKKKKRFTKDQEKHWDHMYLKLLMYKAEHGHCNVPSTDQVNKKLAEWVYVQRGTYRRGDIDERRQQSLENAGFDWYPRGQRSTKCTEESNSIEAMGISEEVA